MGSQRVLLGPLRRRDPVKIGPYLLLGRLGAGSMGRVYLGRSAAGRLVAVKTIRPEYAEEPDFRARFAQEVAAARRVSGVFTASVVAADSDADVPWLATAYVPAPALDQLVQTCGPLPVPAVRWLAAGCAEALESIHDAGLVHRDLKPSNVLVSPDGPRVIDFGVARALERIQLTTIHGALGTPAYMAPEQARDTRQAVIASDVFSLGSTLLFAATGHAPYQGETVMDILVQLATEPPDLSGLPRELADLVTGCLDRDPRRRPTPAALVTQLAPYVTDAGHDGPPSLPDAGLALIEEYRQRPQPSERVTEPDGDDATVGSQPSLPARAGSPLPARPPADGSRVPGRPVGGRKRVRTPVVTRGRRRGRAFSVVASVGAVVALMVSSGVVGVWINARANQSEHGATTPTPSPSREPRSGPPEPPPPLSGASDRPGDPRRLQVNQPRGDGYTVFVLHGSGWTPGSQVTVTLSGRTSRVTPFVDLAGTFNYAVNQDHEFFPGPIPAGEYTAVARVGGVRAEASFHVRPLTDGPPR
jgi:serine/threonine protein kinase